MIESWKPEPDERPDILQVVLELNSINPSENNNASNDFNSKKSETAEKIVDEDSDSTGYEDFNDCDINADKYQKS